MSFQNAKSISLQVASASVIRAGRVVTIDSNGNAVEATASTDVPAGIAMEASADGDTNAINVALLNGGIVEAEAGAALTVGGLVMSAADGQVIDATGATNYALGVAMSVGGDGITATIMTMSPSFAAQA